MKKYNLFLVFSLSAITAISGLSTKKVVETDAYVPPTVFENGVDYVLLSNIPFDTWSFTTDILSSPPNNYVTRYNVQATLTFEQWFELGFIDLNINDQFVSKPFTFTNFNTEQYLGNSPYSSLLPYSTMINYVSLYGNDGDIGIKLFDSPIVSNFAYGVPYMANYVYNNSDSENLYDYAIFSNDVLVHSPKLSWFNLYLVGLENLPYSFKDSLMTFSLYFYGDNDVHFPNWVNRFFVDSWFGTYDYAMNSLLNYEVGFEDGYNLGNSDGYTSGYTDGYTSGFNDGNSQGYTSGLTDGFNDGVASDFNSFSWLTAIFSAMGGLLSIQLLPNVSIGGILILIMVLTLLPFLIGLLKGGKS